MAQKAIMPKSKNLLKRIYNPVMLAFNLHRNLECYFSLIQHHDTTNRSEITL